MTKLMMRYIGEDDYVAALKCNQLVEVEALKEGETSYTYINKYNEEVYIPSNEVLPYE